MRLIANDQVHISSVKRETIVPGEEFEVSDAAGKQLLEKNPALFTEVKAQGAAPLNKMEPAPANKTEYSAMKVDDLKALAVERNVDLGAAKNKGEIVAAFEAADAAATAKAAEAQD